MPDLRFPEPGREHLPVDRHQEAQRSLLPSLDELDAALHHPVGDFCPGHDLRRHSHPGPGGREQEGGRLSQVHRLRRPVAVQSW